MQAQPLMAELPINANAAMGGDEIGDEEPDTAITYDIAQYLDAPSKPIYIYIHD
jgi:hypothetical protein